MWRCARVVARDHTVVSALSRRPRFEIATPREPQRRPRVVVLPPAPAELLVPVLPAAPAGAFRSAALELPAVALPAAEPAAVVGEAEVLVGAIGGAEPANLLRACPSGAQPSIATHAAANETICRLWRIGFLMGKPPSDFTKVTTIRSYVTLSTRVCVLLRS